MSINSKQPNHYDTAQHIPHIIVYRVVQMLCYARLQVMNPRGIIKINTFNKFAGYATN
jgi:hypothetical protein